MRILLVEDEKSYRTLLGHMLRVWKYNVLVASDGLEAWHMLCNEEIQFVISDLLMPNIDGMELCRRIRGANLPHYVYCILLTGMRDKASLISGMEAGADDFLSKPFDPEELQVRIRAGERVLRLEQTLQQRNAELSEVYSRIRRDLEAAARMQQSLLPGFDHGVGHLSSLWARQEHLNTDPEETDPEETNRMTQTIIMSDQYGERCLLPKMAVTMSGITFDWLFRPCAFVAGDIFNFFRLDEHHLSFYHIDVAGHGIPSAMLSVTLSRVLSPTVGQHSLLKHPHPAAPYYKIIPPSEVISALNQQFQSHDDSLPYFTMIYGLIDTRVARVTLTQAGHPSPVYLPKEGKAVLLGTGGFPVGMFPDVEYETLTLDFQRGDRLVLYSDGVTECLNKTSEPFTERRLMRSLEDAGALPLDEVLHNLQRNLHAWKGDNAFEDDVSVLAFEAT